MAFRKLPGASWAPGRPQEGALGGKGRVGKLYGGLGVLLAPLRPVSGRFSPPAPGGGPGEAPGGHFWTFFGRPSRDLKNEQLFVVF